MDMLTVFLCNPEASLHAELVRQTLRDEQLWRQEQDAEEDEQLAAEFDPEVDEWPWWLEPPVQVVHPVVLDHSYGLAVEENEDEDDDAVRIFQSG